jgi:hypothetical protein
MIFNRVRSELEAWRHQAALSGILKTAPISEGHPKVVVLSQVCARDFLMYLLAAKSFAHRTEGGRFTVLDDGSLTPEHYDLLQEHLPGIAIHHIDSVHSDATPRGGTWERLLKLVELGERSYVVQLDADTITLGPLDEAWQCIHRGTGFTLTSEIDARIIPIGEAAANAQLRDSRHFQIAAEAQLDKLDPAMAANYVRGCSAFTGLPPGDRRSNVEAISRRMRELMGERWSEWGSEQVTSNLLTASSPGAVLLAPPKYATHEGRALAPDTRFAHFLGTYRFSSNVYRRLGAAAMAAL